jgi:hypothetical protein
VYDAQSTRTVSPGQKQTELIRPLCDQEPLRVVTAIERSPAVMPVLGSPP